MVKFKQYLVNYWRYLMEQQKRTPESLFNQIAQDSETLQIFKHHSIRVMYLSTMLAKRVDCYDEDLHHSVIA